METSSKPFTKEQVARLSEARASLDEAERGKSKKAINKARLAYEAVLRELAGGDDEGCD